MKPRRVHVEIISALIAVAFGLGVLGLWMFSNPHLLRFLERPLPS